MRAFLAVSATAALRVPRRAHPFGPAPCTAHTFFARSNPTVVTFITSHFAIGQECISNLAHPMPLELGESISFVRRC